MTVAVHSPAERALGFIESLPQTKGRWAGEPLELMDWQRGPLERIFGELDESGNRKYQRTFWFVPRKNGKSTLAAAIALYLLFADREPGAEVYGAAYDREQAGIVFDQALAMLKSLPGNEEREGPNPVRWKAYAREKRIVVPSTNSKYEAIPAVAAGSHGYNASGIIFDEFHTQADRELWDVLRTSTGSREQPLIFVITTAGNDRHSPCFKEYEYACKVRDGVIDDPGYLPVIYEADDEDEWLERDQWERANPGLGTTVREGYIESEAAEAARDPEKENTFKRLHLNLWTTNEAKVIGVEQWDACAGEFSEASLYGRPCFGGIDLASKEDLTALVWAFPFDDHVKYLPRIWVPEATVEERTRRDAVPYREWAKQGWLDTTPGSWVDHDYIEQRVEQDAGRFDVQELAFDDWNCGNMPQHLQRRGLTVLTMRMGYKSLSEPTKTFLAMVRAASRPGGQRQLVHDGNPVMRWAASNLVTTESPMGDIKPAKNKSAEKIDPIVAAIMATDRMSRHDEGGESVYEDRGIRAL